VLEGILVGIIDASLLRKAMQSCSGVDTDDPIAGALEHPTVTRGDGGVDQVTA
jgi:hypothetical protein